jgi:phosphoserine phosphatase
MKLLVLDVEGTLFRAQVRLPGTTIDSTIWQGIANALGPDAIREEVATHKKWASGGYSSYTEWMKDTITIHKKYGLSKTLFQELIDSAQYNPGVLDALRNVDRSKYELLIVSGGFRELAARAQKDIGIIHAFAACEYLFGEDGKLKAYNLLPCDFEGKMAVIAVMLRECGIRSEDWIFIGDGINDLPVASQAPISIGYCPHPELRKKVTYTINDFSELPQILESLS